MQLCATTLVSLLLAPLVGQGPEQPKKPSPRELAAAQELQKLQGTWVFESLEENGKKMSAGDLKGRTLFIGVDAFIVRNGTSIVQAGNLSLDPGRKPKTVNAIVKQGEHKGDIMLGIYTLDGDTLKVCYDAQEQDRPKELRGYDSPVCTGIAMVELLSSVQFSFSIEKGVATLLARSDAGPQELVTMTRPTRTCFNQ